MDWHSLESNSKKRECARDFEEREQVVDRVIQTDGRRMIVKLTCVVAGLC
jgi:hypothetical protein